MEQFKVVEKFVSINGEGKKAGQLSTFIRFRGCNLDCDYCDTKWANEMHTNYESMTCEDICEYIMSTKVNNVTITGGEPLIQPGIGKLLGLLSEVNRLYIEIETNGSIDISPYINISKNITFTLDYKLSASGMEDKMLIDNYKVIRPEDTVKFVVANKYDLNKTKDIIDRYLADKSCGLYISPVYGMIEPAEIVDYMVAYNMNGVNAQLQLHKYIWDPNKKGV